jgi:CheY-like chemotaxis protein
VALPLQAGEPVTESGRSLNDAPLLAETPRERLLEGLWVVVVDDEVDARELAAMVLEDRGAVVTLAASAAEALAVFNQDGHSLGLSRLPDLLISDIAMPGEDGYALIQNIRTLPPQQGGQVAAIALTACAREEERSQALAAGFQVHLSKPVLPTTLVAKVAALTGRSAGLQQSPTAEPNPPAV